MKRILLTGGGTAGHVTPNLALIPGLRQKGYELSYIGSYHGMEKELIEREGIAYYGISSGKLRRYFDLKNFSDPFRVVKGYFEARNLIKKLKPAVVFSKGGFVAVPVVLAAAHLKVPVVIHESDLSPGLANKLCIPSATYVCCNFPETLSYLPKEKAVLSGSPIRETLLRGSRLSGLRKAGLSPDKPVLMVIGGSLGSVKVNKAVREALPALLEKFQVLHLCGKGNLDSGLLSTAGYAQYEYANEELCDFYAAADLVISRAGANVICELLALRKPNLLIPLSASASRGDQLLNARSFEKQGFSQVLEEENLSRDSLLSAVENLYENRERFVEAMEKSPLSDGVSVVTHLLEKLAE